MENGIRELKDLTLKECADFCMILLSKKMSFTVIAYKDGKAYRFRVQWEQ